MNGEEIKDKKVNAVPYYFISEKIFGVVYFNGEFSVAPGRPGKSGLQTKMPQKIFNGGQLLPNLRQKCRPPPTVAENDPMNTRLQLSSQILRSVKKKRLGNTEGTHFLYRCLEKHRPEEVKNGDL